MALLSEANTETKGTLSYNSIQNGMASTGSIPSSMGVPPSWRQCQLSRDAVRHSLDIRGGEDVKSPLGLISFLFCSTNFTHFALVTLHVVP